LEEAVVPEYLEADIATLFDDWQPGAPPARLSAALFDGALIVMRGLEPVERLCRRARTLVEEAFDTSDPVRAETRMAPAAFRQAAVRARRAVEQDTDVDQCWRDSLAAIGHEPAACWLDRIKLRVVPSCKEMHGRVIRPLPPHRDTWGSGIMAQINWWLPLYPLDARRTMLLWPQMFRRPIANDSAGWDYEALIQGERKDYPLLPIAAEMPPDKALPVLIEPGALLGFSAAHLHASTTDASGLCRFSIDTRSIWADDLSTGRGAPNVDGCARRAHWEWFRRPSPG